MLTGTPQGFARARLHFARGVDAGQMCTTWSNSGMREREGHLKLYILLSALHPLIDEIGDLKRATANDIEVIPEPILSRMLETLLARS